MNYKNFTILLFAMALTGCSAVPEQHEQQKQLVKTVATIAVVIAIAGAVGKQNQQSKCANNRAGFWQDHSTGKIYTCP